IAGGHKVFKHDVDHVFVKDFHFAKRVDVHLQALKFDASFMRDVFKTNGRKIWKIRKRTDTSKLGDLEIDSDLFSRKLLGEGSDREEGHLFPRGRPDIQSLLIRRWQMLL